MAPGKTCVEEVVVAQGVLLCMSVTYVENKAWMHGPKSANVETENGPLWAQEPCIAVPAEGADLQLVAPQENVQRDEDQVAKCDEFENQVMQQKGSKPSIR